VLLEGLDRCREQTEQGLVEGLPRSQ